MCNNPVLLDKLVYGVKFISQFVKKSNISTLYNYYDTARCVTLLILGGFYG